MAGFNCDRSFRGGCLGIAGGGYAGSGRRNRADLPHLFDGRTAAVLCSGGSFFACLGNDATRLHAKATFRDGGTGPDGVADNRKPGCGGGMRIAF